MNAHSKEPESALNSLALGIWENEGGALKWDSMDHHYGRRVESDGSWSIYHVYTGRPAAISGYSMTGLSKLDAGKDLIRLNLRSEQLRHERQSASQEDGRSAAREVGS